ncbi:MAG TPA: hypothetical protein VFN78_01610, partial [Ktedonobacterales bacterium]|nr:hypothetical protein [Ktedonobacterales bacterium]
MKRSRSIFFGALAMAGATVAAAALVMTASVGQVSASPAHGSEVLHSIHTMGVKPAKPARPTKSSNLSYHGGTSGSGVETGADKVYLIYWGSQWNSNDPSGEASIQQNFFNHVGGSSWNNSVTQYCQGVASGTITCGTSGTHATNPTGLLAGVWYDNAAAAPSRPTQSQLASEAVNAAAHFGNTTAAANT